MNVSWHREHVLGRATRAQRIAWHREHQRACGCRPPPASIAAEIEAAPRATMKKARAAKGVAAKGVAAKAGVAKAGTKKSIAKQGLPKAVAAKRVAAKAGVAKAGTKKSIAKQGLPKAGAKKGTEGPLERAFARVVDALSSETGVSYGGKGFGSRGLKHDGRLFAMVTPRGDVAAKLPRARVDALIASGAGGPFDTGGGRVMKKWVVLTGTPASLEAHVREALEFARDS